MVETYHCLLHRKMGIIRMVTDREIEYCGKEETHDHELYLAGNGIEHTKIKMCHLRTSAVCERFHKIFSNEFCQIAFHRKLYHPFEEL